MGSQETQENVSSRVVKAMQDLALKGEQQRIDKEKKAQEAQVRAQEEREERELEQIRQARLARMKREQGEKEANKAKGHGQVTYITQDEFLPTVLGSTRCVIHFFHKEFERCQVVDERLKVLAPLHLETRFARIDAEKAPFFVSKLAIKVLPTLVCFEEGKAIDRKMGYSGETAAEQLVDLEKSLFQAGVLDSIKCKSKAEGAATAIEHDGSDQEDSDEEDVHLRRRGVTSLARAHRSQATGDDW